MTQPKMGKYTVGMTWSFKERNFETFHAGDVIELEEDVAENYMHNEPGLLTPARQTTQAHPEVVRTRSAAKSRKRK